MKYMINNKSLSYLILSSLILICSGCSTANMAKEPKGSWNLINTHNSSIEAKELERSYYYGALSIDTSLNSMIGRWAADTNITVVYQCRFDYSIPVKLLKSQMTSLKAAMHEMMSAYSTYGIIIEFNIDKSGLIISCGVNNKADFLKPPSVIGASKLRFEDID